MVTKLGSQRASRVYIAEDADLFIKNRIRSLCASEGVPVQMSAERAGNSLRD